MTGGRAAGRLIDSKSRRLQAGRKDEAVAAMRRIKIVMLLVILAAGGLIGYAYLADLAPEQIPMSIPVEIPGNAGAD